MQSFSLRLGLSIGWKRSGHFLTYRPKRIRSHLNGRRQHCPATPLRSSPYNRYLRRALDLERSTRLIVLTALFFLLQPVAPQTAAPADPAIAISQAEVEQHLTGPDTINTLFIRVKRSPKELRDSIFTAVAVDTVTDTAGDVVSAKASPEPDGQLPPATLALAEARVRELHFKPFERNGHTVAAKFQLPVSVLPQELRPARHVPFPSVKDWNSVKITLERASPFATDYTVTVLGDGTVLFKGSAATVVSGRHRGTVPPSNVAELVKLFEQTDYFCLRDEYVVPTDAERHTTSIEIDGRRKQVVNAAGLELGMPLAVERLEDAIDRLAGSERWTRGNAETLAALEAEHWDFRSAQAANTLARAAQASSFALVHDLVRAGAPLSGHANVDPESGYRCCSALVVAAEHGDSAMLKLLLDAGAGANLEQLGQALVAAAGSGNLAIFRLLVDNRADINARDRFGHTVLMAASASGSPAMVKEVLKFHPDVNAVAVLPPRPCAASSGAERASPCEPAQADGHTALMEAAWSHGSDVPSEGVDRVEVVRLLLAVGADVNARDALGNTTLLLSTHDPEIVRLLLEARADPNARDSRGLTALGRTSNENVRRVLIEHGALESPSITHRRGGK
jgi:hypothetical protein